MLRHRRLETIMLVTATFLQPWIVADADADTAPVVNDDRAKPLKLVLTRPSYRNTIFASLPVAKIQVEAYPSMHINPGLPSGCSRLSSQALTRYCHPWPNGVRIHAAPGDADPNGKSSGDLDS